MANRKTRRREQRRRLPLSARLSLLVLAAALLPLAAVVGVNDYFARDKLVHQGTTALTNDAAAQVSLVDTYLRERELDGAALASLPTAPAYLGCVTAQLLQATQPQQAFLLSQQLKCGDPVQGADFYQGSNCRALRVGITRDSNYTDWSLHIAHGEALLSSNGQKDTCVIDPKAPGLTVPKEDLTQVQQGHPWISAVYFDPKTKHAYVNVYNPVTAAAIGGGDTVLGFLAARLNTNYIDSIVQGEQGADGNGSFAFVTDENGVRVIDANASDRFTAIAPLTAAAQQLITSEQRYGGGTAVTQQLLPAAASSLKSKAVQDSFQGLATPDGAVQYQFVRIHLKNVPWTYFVLSPLPTVTAVADDQVKLSLFSAGIIAILAVLIGLIVGRGTAGPVQSATGNLEGAAVALQKLAARQQSSASEQQWVVDACKTGLDSVRYLSDAMNQAARRVFDASNWFHDYWDRLTEEQARRTVQHLNELARYIEEAARRQQASSERLGKAITVTIQVSDQLVAGANAATESANQLEYVVGNLQRVVGGKIGRNAVDEMEEQADEADQMALVASPYADQQPGRMQMPMPQSPRQLAAPGMSANGWNSAPPRAPRAPWAAPGQSQVFDGSYMGTPSGGYSPSYGPAYGQPAYGQQDQWAGAGPSGSAGRANGWGDR